MRVSNWTPEKFDSEFIDASIDRLKKAAEVVAEKARELCPIVDIISDPAYIHPVYKTGKYARKSWTKRDIDALKNSIRVVTKNDTGALITHARDVRVYAGNYDVYYAKIVEYKEKKFLRPALNRSKQTIRSILENG